MKSILSILLFVGLNAFAEVPPFQTVILAYDSPRAGEVTFYIRATNGPSFMVIGVTTNTTFTWTNVTPLPYRLGVTASNIWGESQSSTPLILPANPVAPTNLRPVTTVFRISPPASFERTTDLAVWGERFRLFAPDSNGLQTVMQTITPEEPFQFYRLRTVPNLPPPHFP